LTLIKEYLICKTHDCCILKYQIITHLQIVNLKVFMI